MIRAVLDTNVLASGFVGYLNPYSIPAQLLHAWGGGRFELIVSKEILTELERTFQSPYFQKRLTAEQIEHALALLRRRAVTTPITVDVASVATQPEDDRILAAAVSGGADYLVTGDMKLQQIGIYQGVTIVTPRAFLAALPQL